MGTHVRIKDFKIKKIKKKRKKNQRRKGKRYPFEGRVPKNSKEK